MKKVDWDSIGVVVFLLITFICKLFSCVLHGVYAFQDGRRGLSTFKNMPFLPQEGRFLRARRAYTRMQNVTHWFLVGYILGCRWWYMRVVRVVSLVGCKDYLSSHELSSLTYITPNESWNALCSLYAGGLLWARNCAQKGSVRSVSSVRDKTPHWVSSLFFFSQNTQMNRTHKVSQRHQVNR